MTETKTFIQRARELGAQHAREKRPTKLTGPQVLEAVWQEFELQPDYKQACTIAAMAYRRGYSETP